MKFEELAKKMRDWAERTMSGEFLINHDDAPEILRILNALEKRTELLREFARAEICESIKSKPDNPDRLCFTMCGYCGKHSEKDEHNEGCVILRARESLEEE